MGLDMFLTKIVLKKDRKKRLHEEVAYWRKVPQIHNWFVANNCGEDDQKPQNVTKENLQELYNICENVVKSLKDSPVSKTTVGTVFENTAIAKTLLPTDNDIYDQYYLDSTINTISMIKPLLVDSWDNTSMYYQASW